MKGKPNIAQAGDANPTPSPMPQVSPLTGLSTNSSPMVMKPQEGKAEP